MSTDELKEILCKVYLGEKHIILYNRYAWAWDNIYEVADVIQTLDMKVFKGSHRIESKKRGLLKLLTINDQLLCERIRGVRWDGWVCDESTFSAGHPQTVRGRFDEFVELMHYLINQK